MEKDVLLNIIKDRPVSYHADFAKVMGSVTAGLFICQAIYWTGKGSQDDGWFYKSRDEWKNELGMSRKEQETARKKLCKEGVLEEHLKGIPARLYYRVNFDRLIELMGTYYDTKRTPVKSSWPESDHLDGTNMTSKKERKSLPYNTENTTEITTSVVVEANPSCEKFSDSITASSSDDESAFCVPIASNLGPGIKLQAKQEEKTQNILPKWEIIRTKVRAVSGTDIPVCFAKEIVRDYPQSKIDSTLSELNRQLTQGVKIRSVGSWLRYGLKNNIVSDQPATTNSISKNRENNKKIGASSTRHNGLFETSYPRTLEQEQKHRELIRSLYT